MGWDGGDGGWGMGDDNDDDDDNGDDVVFTPLATSSKAKRIET